MTSILSGWREQYDRMIRSHARLLSVTDRSTALGSDDARDALVHFFEDAYHLKDWIGNDVTLSRRRFDVEKAVNNSMRLTICADICNGVKHFNLRRGRGGGAGAEIVGQGLTIGLPTARWPEPDEADEGWIEHSWHIEYRGRTYDAAKLAAEVVAAWDRWLTTQGLLSARVQR